MAKDRPDSLAVRHRADGVRDQARAWLAGSFVYVSGPPVVVGAVLEALSDATGSSLPTAELSSSPADEPLPGQTDIYDFVD
jgi:hypothetical protein